MFSGGLGSFATAKIVADKFGTETLVLLFADTKTEDEDLYRFLEEAAAYIGGSLVRIEDGRDVWQVFRDAKFIGNSRIDPCSKYLKREMCDRWIQENCTLEDTIIYVGIDWSEIHRYERLRVRKLPWKYEAPLTEGPPYYSHQKGMQMLQTAGIQSPRLYGMGFHHNNCGGFCVKAGQAHFRLLYEQMPERYLYHEQRERILINENPKLRPFLKKRINGKDVYLTLQEFREKYLIPRKPIDDLDWGGCNCLGA
jgi:hypothetical protein